MGALVVHIGLPKTGSTAVQQFLANNHVPLAEYGLRYTDAIRGPNHVQLAVAFSRRTTSLTASVGVRSTADRLRLRARIRERLVREAADDIATIISSEHLSSHLRTAEEITDLAGFLRGIADEVTVIGLLRRADYWLPSAYAEAVFAGTQLPMGRRFVRRRAHLLDHSELLDQWGRAFGVDAVKALPFLEADKRDPAAVAVRLLGQLGVPEAHVRTWPVAPALSRAGLSAAATEALRRLSPTLADGGLRPGRERARLRADLAERMPGRPVRLTPAAKVELTRGGWIHNGVDESAHAVGDDWVAWREQPDAPTRKPPTLSDDALESLLTDLRHDGVIGHRGARRVTTRVRGLALRVIRP